MSSKSIYSKDAPKPIGPYSQAIELNKFNSLLFISGQIGLNEKGELKENIEEQTEQVLKNLGYILKEGNSDYNKVVKTTILLSDMNDFEKVNKIYGKYFTQEPLPARATFAVKTLPKNALIEIECIAYQ